MTTEESRRKIAEQKVLEVINGMLKIISKVDLTDSTVVSQLANMLDILLTQAKYTVNSEKKPLLEYALGNVDVPAVLSVDEIIKEVYDARVQTAKEIPGMGTNLTFEEFQKTIQVAHSFIVYGGLTKMAVKDQQRVPLANCINTKIMAIRNSVTGELCMYSIQDVIRLIRNKEASHFDMNAPLEPNDKFYALHLLKDRHLVVLGVAEYLISTYNLLKGDYKGWRALYNVPRLFCFHVTYFEDPIGYYMPLVATWEKQEWYFSPNMFELFRKLREGEIFKICEVNSECQLLVNDKYQIVIRGEGKEDVVVVPEIKDPPTNERAKEMLYDFYNDTATLLVNWEKWEAAVEMVNRAEMDLTDIQVPEHVALLWHKAVSLSNLNPREKSIACYMKLIKIAESIDPEQLDYSLLCHRYIGTGLFNLANLHFSLGHFDDAIDTLKNLVEKMAKSYEGGEIIHDDLYALVVYGLNQMAIIYMKQNDDGNARQACEDLLNVPEIETKMPKLHKWAKDSLSKLPEGE